MTQHRGEGVLGSEPTSRYVEEIFNQRAEIARLREENERLKQRYDHNVVPVVNKSIELNARIEALEGLVAAAYLEGFADGFSCEDNPGIPLWSTSNARRALESSHE